VADRSQLRQTPLCRPYFSKTLEAFAVPLPASLNPPTLHAFSIPSCSLDRATVAPLCKAIEARRPSPLLPMPTSSSPYPTAPGDAKANHDQEILASYLALTSASSSASVARAACIGHRRRGDTAPEAGGMVARGGEGLTGGGCIGIRGWEVKDRGKIKMVEPTCKRWFRVPVYCAYFGERPSYRKNGLKFNLYCFLWYRCLWGLLEMLPCGIDQYMLLHSTYLL
jgi:hypothetical protein